MIISNCSNFFKISFISVLLLSGYFFEILNGELFPSHNNATSKSNFDIILLAKIFFKALSAINNLGNTSAIRPPRVKFSISAVNV